MQKKTHYPLLVLAALALCACRHSTPDTESSVYKTLTVTYSPQTLQSEYSARIAGEQVVEIRPQISGLITRICIDEGQNVSKGQVLFEIDPVPYRAALEEASASVASAEARVATAQLNMESTETLRQKDIVSEFDLNQARNELAQAKAELAQAKAKESDAQNNLSYTLVKSPLSGVAGMIAYRVGALVSANISEPLVTVSDNRTIYAYFSMTESQVLNLTEHYGSIENFMKQMPEVELRMSNGKTYAEKGHIGAVSGIVSAGTGAVTLRADFPNPKGLLREGGSGSVLVPTRLDSCMVIPQAATYELQNRIFVYKVVDGKACSTPVSVFRLNNGKEYAVEEGLEAGDVIIAEGAGLIQEGTVVDL